MKEIRIGRHRIGAGAPCYVIAEIGHNHQGDLPRALRMIEVAADCGVQAVKFQKRHNRTLFTKTYFEMPYVNGASYGLTYGQHREALEFDEQEYRQLKDRAEALGLDFLVTPFDRPSVDFCEALDVPAFKIASGDITNTPLLDYVARIGKPMLVSTGAATLAEVEIAHDTITAINYRLCLLHAVAAYPTPYGQLNLERIAALRTRFSHALIGYSCHANGTLSGSIARALGAVVLEKHFTLDRGLKGTDHKFSLEPSELRRQVEELRDVDLALQPHPDEIRDLEKSARNKMGKGVYAASAIAAGTLLAPELLCLKSPGTDMPPYLLKELHSRRLRRDIGADEPIHLDDLLPLRSSAEA